MKGNTEDRGYNVTAFSSTRTIPLLKRTDLSCLSFGLLRPDIARYCGNKLGLPEVVLCDKLRSLPMNDQERLRRFESELLPLMNDAYNLARWLVQNDQDAHDMVQEAYLRAFKFFGGMRAVTSKAWLLRIVRNVCYDHLRKRQVPSDSSDSNQEDLPDTNPSPEAVLETKSEIAAVRKALANLPEDFRTVLVLREMEELSYREISEITQVPIGTVMSRLARGRQHLTDSLKEMRAKDLL